MRRGAESDPNSAQVAGSTHYGFPTPCEGVPPNLAPPAFNALPPLERTPKKLGLPEECANFWDSEGRGFVVPDVIVHRRGADGPNILVARIEEVYESDAARL
jgi:hypothetical protein